VSFAKKLSTHKYTHPCKQNIHEISDTFFPVLWDNRKGRTIKKKSQDPHRQNHLCSTLMKLPFLGETPQHLLKEKQQCFQVVACSYKVEETFTLFHPVPLLKKQQHRLL